MLPFGSLLLPSLFSLINSLFFSVPFVKMGNYYSTAIVGHEIEDGYPRFTVHSDEQNAMVANGAFQGHK